MTDLTTQKQEIFDYVNAMLGGGMIDVELDPIHYNTALTKALTRYRQRSPNAVEESYLFLTLIEDQNEYILPQEVIEVRQLFRRSVGARGAGSSEGSLFEPFHQSHINTHLLTANNTIGGLATFELFHQRQELMGRMFGGFIEFKWNPTTKKLTILQRPRAEENILIYAYNYRPDSQIIADYLAVQWIKDYTLATCKYMLGEARSKFSTIAGPQGGTTLNGDTLKSEAQQDMEKLDTELTTSVSGGGGYTWLIG
jgi:hypothetical protein